MQNLDKYIYATVFDPLFYMYIAYYLDMYIAFYLAIIAFAWKYLHYHF